MDKTKTTDNMLALLLGNDPPKRETKEFKVKRLSEAWGQDVIFTLRGLSYSRVAEITRTSEDSDIHTLLAGVVSPPLGDKDLMEKYGEYTPKEVVKKLLLPGEVTELAREVQRLSGFRQNVLEEVKKN